MRWLDIIIDSMDMSVSKLWENLKNREAWHAAAHEVTKSRMRLSDWTTITRFESQLKFGFQVRKDQLKGVFPFKIQLSF